MTVKDEVGNTLEKKVETGIANNESIEITTGLDIGDTVYYEIYSMDTSYTSAF